MEKKLVALCVALFMTACLIFVGCSNTADNGGASSTMTEAEAIAAIKALQSGGSITIKLGSSVKTISTDLQRALRDPNKKVTLDLSQSGVTSIGNDAFWVCTSLTSVKIPSGVTSIGDRAFCFCYSLASVEIHSGVTSIGKRAFANCSSLSSVEIPDSVTIIGETAFYNCSSLSSVEIHSGDIGRSAFHNCSSLSSVKIHSGVMSIGESAFQGCSSLTSVEIPDSVTSIGNLALSGCESLYTIKYTGTKEKWNTISTSFGNAWRFKVPAEGVTCSDGKKYRFKNESTLSADYSKLGDEI